MNTNEERLNRFIAQMNVFSQHKKAMEETARPRKRSGKKRKNKGYENNKKV